MCDWNWKDCTELDSVLEDFPGLFEAVVIDCETTGIYRTEIVGGHERRNYVLQLSIISAHTGICLYNGYFKPRIKAWPEAERVNGITWDMVKGCPTFKKESKKIQEIVDAARVIVGYNVGFDIGFLEHEGISFDKLRYKIDVMEDFANFYGDFHPFFHSFTWKKLVLAAKYSGFDWSSCPAEAHNSWADCLATLHVARWLQERFNQGKWDNYSPPCEFYEADFGCDDCGEKSCKMKGVI